VTTSTGASSSGYGFTGEYQSGDSVYLQSRFYAPSTGRFLTRDTWPGEVNRPLSLNRWGYVEANPVNFVDPTGYYPLAIFLSEPGARAWQQNEINTVQQVVRDVANAYAKAFNNEQYLRLIEACGPNYRWYLAYWAQISPMEAFNTIHRGGIRFLRKAEDRAWWGFAYSQTEIHIYNNVTSDMIERHPRLIVHEIGHSFEGALHSEFRTDPRFQERGRYSNSGQYEVGRYGLTDDLWFRNYDDVDVTDERYGGFAGGFENWQYSHAQGPYNPVTQTDGRGEIFADMFIGWVYNTWETAREGSGWSPTGTKRANYMNTNMPVWIYEIITKRGGARWGIIY
jgi:RHS repeat-associated protein